MIDVAIRFSYTDTPKGIRKHASKKVRRRADVREVRDSLLASIEQDTPTSVRPTYPDDPADVKAPFCLLVWDDGLDYNMDGTAYQDDCPGDHPHSYHLTRKDAEIMAAILEDGGCDPNRITIVENFWVPFWDAHRIPKS